MAIVTRELPADVTIWIFTVVWFILSTVAVLYKVTPVLVRDAGAVVTAEVIRITVAAQHLVLAQHAVCHVVTDLRPRQAYHPLAQLSVRGAQERLPLALP